jgi:hypothetical protein
MITDYRTLEVNSRGETKQKSSKIVLKGHRPLAFGDRILTAREGTAWGISFTTSTGTPGIDAWGNVFQTSPISGTSINAMSITQVIGDNNRFTSSGYGYRSGKSGIVDTNSEFVTRFRLKT